MRWALALAASALLTGCGPQAPETLDKPTASVSPEASLVEPPQSPISPSAPETRLQAVSCATNEQTVFSCNLGNGKRVAVCAAGEWLGHYRYGGDVAELELSGGRLANVMYSGGGESQIAFENRGYRYIVFSRMVRTNFTPGEPNNPAISDGVMVMKDGVVADMHLCEDAGLAPVNITLANAIWEAEDDLFTWETGRADPATAE